MLINYYLYSILFIILCYATSIGYLLLHLRVIKINKNGIYVRILQNCWVQVEVQYFFLEFMSFEKCYYDVNMNISSKFENDWFHLFVYSDRKMEPAVYQKRFCSFWKQCFDVCWSSEQLGENYPSWLLDTKLLYG